MFRAALLSIVLSLAVGPNVALLCRTWCDGQVAAASECHHEHSSSTSSVASEEHCGTVAVAAIALPREDTRSDVSFRDATQAIPVPRYQFAHLKVDARPDQEPWRERSLEKRPLSTALRI